MARPPGISLPEIDRCFACGPENERGLHLEARQEGERTVIDWQAPSWVAGWDTALHGGIVATLLDEVAAFAMIAHCKQFGMTRELTVRYLRRTTWTEPLRAEAWLVARAPDLARIGCRIVQGGQPSAEADVTFKLLGAPPRRAA